MDIKFVTEDKLDKYVKAHNIHFLQGNKTYNNMRGITVVEKGDILVNISAKQWKYYLDYGEEKLVEKIGETLVHETVHYIIGTNRVTPDGYTINGEEEVCMLLAGQRDLYY